VPAETVTPEDVARLYEALLGRAPTAADVEHQIAAGATVAQLVRVILASDEYRALRDVPPAAAAAAPTVNVYDERFARFTHPPGTRSADGAAMVGRDGWLFLVGGTNAVLEQYTGAAAMADGWLEDWRALDERRREDLARLDVTAASLVVPDKLAVHAEHLPQPPEARGPRPVQRLRDEAGLRFSYPLELLRAAAAERAVFRRTDSHLSLHGNALLAAEACAALGAPAPPSAAEVQTVEHVFCGDLGSRFAPQVVEVLHSARDLGAATVVADNFDRLAAAGRHVGTLQVLANPTAPDPRTVVVFGDSFGYAAPRHEGVAWFLAQVFREVHMAWLAFGWDPAYVERVGARAVLFESAERFLARVPPVRTDVEALAAEALADRSPGRPLRS
jgi:hypothetical protein